MSPNPERHPSEPQHTGISNRETPQQEEAERHEHPPIDPGPPPPADAGGNVGDAQTSTDAGNQTSNKTGTRSLAQKQDEARYLDETMPPNRKASGAFGKEPQD